MATEKKKLMKYQTLKSKYVRRTKTLKSKYVRRTGQIMIKLEISYIQLLVPRTSLWENCTLTI